MMNDLRRKEILGELFIKRVINCVPEIPVWYLGSRVSESLGISDMGEQSPVNLSMGFWSPRMPDMGEQSPVKSVRGCADTNKSDRVNINVLERREKKILLV